MAGVAYRAPAVKLSSSIGVTLIGNILPLVIVALSFPWLNTRLGTETFGFFLAGWASLGITSLLDLGLGRAITHHVAIYCKDGDVAHKELANASFAFLILLGLALTLGGVIVWWAYGALVSNASARTVYESSLLLVLSIIPATATSGIRGAIEGAGRFVTASVLRSAAAPLFLVFPVVASALCPTPMSIALSFLAGRWAVAALYFASEARTVGILQSRRWLAPPIASLKPVASYSGWVGTSNIVGTLIAYLDRLLLPLSAGLQQMAYYATPFELASRLLVIPGSMVTVIFASMSSEKHNHRRVRQIVSKSYIICIAIMLPLASTIALLAGPILVTWMGDVFSSASIHVLQLICVGVVFNALAHMPFYALQAIGHPRVPAIIHLIELLPSLALYYLFIRHSGAIGAAAAWTLRALADLLVMHFAYVRTLRILEAAQPVAAIGHPHD